MTPVSKDRLREITRRKTYPAQVRQLQALGIRFGVSADKKLVVLEEEVKRALMSGSMSDKVEDPEPDWSALDASQAKP